MSSGKPKCFAQQFIGIRPGSKCPTLFSFNEVGPGAEWPSDDSNDSDYDVKDIKTKDEVDLKPNCKISLPPEDTNDNHDKKEGPIKLIFSNCGPRKKVSRRKSKEGEEGIKKRKKSRKNRNPSEEESALNDGSNHVYDLGWSRGIPREILLYIFKLVIRSEGVVPFVPRASKVCRLWNEVASDSSLWIKADLSSGRVNRSEEHLKWLCMNRMSQTKEINLSGWGKIVTTNGIQAISNHCSKLTSINLNRCSKLTNLCIRKLVDNCPNLSTFDLTAVTDCGGSSQTSPVSTSSITYVIEKRSSSLKDLSLASNYLLSFHVPLIDLYAKCSNLAVLDLSDLKPEGRSIAINLEKLQSGCPKLQVLRLANTLVQLSNATLVEQNAAPGFPELEELSIAVSKTSSWIGLQESVLERIVKCSKKLRLLDVRGCSHTASSIVRIPSWDIEHLFLSRCESTKRQGLELIIQKWCHSLVNLDLSWNTCPVEIMDQAVMALSGVGAEKSNLKELDLHGSTVSFAPIQDLLRNCPKLQCLDLSSCRGLPRGIKRLYQSKDDIDTLRHDIIAFE